MPSFLALRLIFKSTDSRYLHALEVDVFLSCYILIHLARIIGRIRTKVGNTVVATRNLYSLLDYKRRSSFREYDERDLDRRRETNDSTRLHIYCIHKSVLAGTIRSPFESSKWQ